MLSNEKHIQRAIDLVISYDKKRIGILGISFKGDTDDLRESPMVDVVETLSGKGYDLSIYDKNVNLAKLFGANKQYNEEKKPHISNLMVNSIDDVLKHAEVLVIGNKNKEFDEIINNIDRNYKVIDFVGIKEENRPRNISYEGLCW